MSNTDEKMVKELLDDLRRRFLNLELLWSKVKTHDMLIERLDRKSHSLQAQLSILRRSNGGRFVAPDEQNALIADLNNIEDPILAAEVLVERQNLGPKPSAQPRQPQTTTLHTSPDLSPANSDRPLTRRPESSESSQGSSSEISQTSPESEL